MEEFLTRVERRVDVFPFYPFISAAKNFAGRKDPPNGGVSKCGGGGKEKEFKGKGNRRSHLHFSPKYLHVVREFKKET